MVPKSCEGNKGLTVFRKKLLLLFLSVAMIVASAMSLVAVNTAKADGLTTLSMTDGAWLYSNVDIQSATPYYGVRFRMNLSAAEYNAIAGDATFGIIIMPEDYVDDLLAGNIEGVNYENVFGASAIFCSNIAELGKTRILDLTSDVMYADAENAENMVLYGAITKILPNNRARNFVAVGYVEHNGTYTFAYNDECNRSIATLALAAKSDPEFSGISDVLDGFLTNVPVSVSVTGCDAYVGGLIVDSVKGSLGDYKVGDTVDISEKAAALAPLGYELDNSSVLSAEIPAAGMANYSVVYVSEGAAAMTTANIVSGFIDKEYITVTGENMSVGAAAVGTGVDVHRSGNDGVTAQTIVLTPKFVAELHSLGYDKIAVVWDYDPSDSEATGFDVRYRKYNSASAFSGNGNTDAQLYGNGLTFDADTGLQCEFGLSEVSYDNGDYIYITGLNDPASAHYIIRSVVLTKGVDISVTVSGLNGSAENNAAAAAIVSAAGKKHVGDAVDITDIATAQTPAHYELDTVNSQFTCTIANDGTCSAALSVVYVLVEVSTGNIVATSDVTTYFSSSGFVFSADPSGNWQKAGDDIYLQPGDTTYGGFNINKAYFQDLLDNGFTKLVVEFRNQPDNSMGVLALYTTSGTNSEWVVTPSYTDSAITGRRLATYDLTGKTTFGYSASCVIGVRMPAQNATLIISSIEFIKDLKAGVKINLTVSGANDNASVKYAIINAVGTKYVGDAVDITSAATAQTPAYHVLDAENSQLTCTIANDGTCSPALSVVYISNSTGNIVATSDVTTYFSKSNWVFDTSGASGGGWTKAGDDIYLQPGATTYGGFYIDKDYFQGMIDSGYTNLVIEFRNVQDSAWGKLALYTTSGTTAAWDVTPTFTDSATAGRRLVTYDLTGKTISGYPASHVLAVRIVEASKNVLISSIEFTK